MKLTLTNNFALYGGLKLEVKRVLTAAQARGIQTNMVDAVSIEEFKSRLHDVGQIVLWNGMSLSTRLGERFLLRTLVFDLLQDRTVVNNVLRNEPFLSYKFYQQQRVASLALVPTITSWLFFSKEELQAALSAQAVPLPFVMKPNFGSKGHGVKVVDSPREIASLPEQLENLVVQEYLPHQRYFRVLIVGGRAVGVMQRVRSRQSPVALADGTRAKRVTDQGIATYLAWLGENIAKRLALDYVGIDFLQHLESGEVFFLELNTAPEWKKFEQVVGIDVAEAIVDMCVQFQMRMQPTGVVVTYGQ